MWQGFEYVEIIVNIRPKLSLYDCYRTNLTGLVFSLLTSLKQLLELNATFCIFLLSLYISFSKYHKFDDI